MPFSAKRSAYRPSPSFSNHSAIGCMAVSIASPVAQFLFLKPVKEAQCYHACHQAGCARVHKTRMEFSLASIIAPIYMTVARLFCICSDLFLRDEIDWSRRLGAAFRLLLAFGD